MVVDEEHGFVALAPDQGSDHRRAIGSVNIHHAQLLGMLLKIVMGCQNRMNKAGNFSLTPTFRNTPKLGQLHQQLPSPFTNIHTYTSEVQKGRFLLSLLNLVSATIIQLICLLLYT